MLGEIAYVPVQNLLLDGTRGADALPGNEGVYRFRHPSRNVVLFEKLREPAGEAADHRRVARRDEFREPPVPRGFEEFCEREGAEMEHVDLADGKAASLRCR